MIEFPMAGAIACKFRLATASDETFDEHIGIVPPEEIVKNPKEAYVPSGKNLEALHATVASLEEHIKQSPKDWKAGVIYAIRSDMVPDVGILLARAMAEVVVGMELELRTEYLADPVWEEVWGRYDGILTAIE